MEPRQLHARSLAFFIAFVNPQTVVLLQIAGPPVLFQADGHLQVAAEIHQAASVSRGAAAVARGAERLLLLPVSASVSMVHHFINQLSLFSSLAYY